ncbi:hypothetical protein GGR25_002766 [Kaistia hirudinis]|uniref:Uncharacterized protein n=1 Tax=Kaistia hirudinis TaxID=1293440 RepID=A0A840ATP8_9HYPH|nr:hypothetical protein [Kaistia hirudinis]
MTVRADFVSMPFMQAFTAGTMADACTKKTAPKTTTTR